MKQVHWLGAVFLLIGIYGCRGHNERILGNGKLGPLVPQTNGQPWPKPQLSTTYGNSVLYIRPNIFQFKIVKHTCDLVEDAFKRYCSIILKTNAYLRKYRQTRDEFMMTNNLYLDTLNVHLMSPCEPMPHDKMDESYEVKINSPDYPGQGLIVASTNWGILRALETFSQLLHPNSDSTSLQVKSILIVDYPRFPFRSFLLDTSRHYLPKKIIYENLDLMAMNKYNIFHWHIVDDESFPYQSTTFPILSEKGAYHPYTHVYTQEDVQDVINYARLRGIRVIPEFDTPGHTLSWVGIPKLLTTCYNETTGEPDGKLGPIDPTVPANFVFLRKLFQEIATVFPDKYIHLGGDEVDFSCWKSNPEIQDFMKASNFSTDYSRLEELYMQNLVDEIQSLPQNKSILVWQEVFDNGVEMDSNTVIHVWKDKESMQELANVTAKGYRAVFSACWYLNIISYGVDWVDYYNCEPHNFTGTARQKKLILGGGATMWGEYIDSTNVISTTWPRAAAPAERLWSAATVNDTEEAAPRLEEHRCRLLQRGFSVSPPNGSGYCRYDWN